MMPDLCRGPNKCLFFFPLLRLGGTLDFGRIVDPGCVLATMTSTFGLRVLLFSSPSIGFAALIFSFFGALLSKTFGLPPIFSGLAVWSSSPSFSPPLRQDYILRLHPFLPLVIRRSRPFSTAGSFHGEGFFFLYKGAPCAQKQFPNIPCVRLAEQGDPSFV